MKDWFKGHDPLEYTVTNGTWDPDEYGNHRVVMEVSPEAIDAMETGGATAPAVCIRIPWRRRDESPEAKGVLLFSGKGTPVKDYRAVSVTRACGEFLFNPVDGAGKYYLYFMPFTGTVKTPYPKAQYLPTDDTETAWRTAVASAHADSLPAAEVVALESIDEFNRFTEMELIATDDEIASAVGGKPYALFPESRERPIRMFDALPWVWAQRGAGGDLSQAARPGEYFVFQVGLYAASADLPEVQVTFSGLQTGNTDDTAIVAPQEFTCFNTSGVGWDGEPFAKMVSVSRGQVQPLWCGVDLPQDIPAGNYQATVTVEAGGTQESVRLLLSVAGTVIPRQGDDDPWRLSRLRWLDSTMGTEDSVVPPYVPVKTNGRDLAILGRELRLSETGLPQAITSRFSDDVQSADADPQDVLAEPIHFSVTRDGVTTQPVSDSFADGESGTGFTTWNARSSAGDLQFDVKGHLDFDGTIDYQIAVTSETETAVDDIALEIGFANESAQLMTGLGRKGGKLPDQFEWEWSVERNQDSVWIGCVNAGLQVTMKDDSYSRPLNTNFYHTKPLVMPGSWCNDGLGGVTMQRHDDCYRLHCTSGKRTIAPGQVVRFDLRLAITPFKPIDTASHFQTRYHHAYEPLDKITEGGGNTVNIHHCTDINPYINYPFLSNDNLGRYISDGHERELAVKLYYTVRELTTRAPELFMLKSLDGEILVHGPAGGHPWLQEHLGTDYLAAWYSLPKRDTSVINGVLSRWHNFYVEGMNWLAENLAIDGVYIDDLGFGRDIMKRVKRVLHKHRPNPMIDLHSANQYNPRDGFASSTNLYLEHFPYLDRLWFGEYFDYNENPEYWLVEISGIPFGLMSEMLQDGGNLWRGMVFGITGRMPRVTSNVEIWKFWDQFGLPEAKMTGFWSKGCPVTTGTDDARLAVYQGTNACVIAAASWADYMVEIALGIDWEAIGIPAERARVHKPEISGIQDGAEIDPAAPLRLDKGKGVLLVIEPTD